MTRHFSFRILKIKINWEKLHFYIIYTKYYLYYVHGIFITQKITCIILSYHILFMYTFLIILQKLLFHTRPVDNDTSFV